MVQKRPQGRGPSRREREDDTAHHKSSKPGSAALISTVGKSHSNPLCWSREGTSRILILQRTWNSGFLVPQQRTASGEAKDKSAGPTLLVCADTWAWVLQAVDNHPDNHPGNNRMGAHYAGGKRRWKIHKVNAEQVRSTLCAPVERPRHHYAALAFYRRKHGLAPWAPATSEWG